jgi:dephospho-CoA kinase
VIRAGLTGGLASGKSHVGRVLEDLGCHVIRADDLGHQALKPDGEAYESVVKEFGRDILDSSGLVNRKLLAAQVFGDPERLQTLNKLVHPVVIRKEEIFLAEAARHDPNGIGVVEAAILIETGSYRRFDRLILAVCTPEQQIERAMHRDGSTLDEAQSRLKRQMSLEEKRKYADYVIDTSGSKEHTAEQTRIVFADLKALAERQPRSEGAAPTSI